MYRFLECTAGRYMTREVKTVTRKHRLRQLGQLFDKLSRSAASGSSICAISGGVEDR